MKTAGFSLATHRIPGRRQMGATGRLSGVSANAPGQRAPWNPPPTRPSPPRALQAGLFWVGASIPAGRLQGAELAEIARVADLYGDGTVRGGRGAVSAQGGRVLVSAEGLPPWWAPRGVPFVLRGRGVLFPATRPDPAGNPSTDRPSLIPNPPTHPTRPDKGAPHVRGERAVPQRARGLPPRDAGGAAVRKVQGQPR